MLAVIISDVVLRVSQWMVGNDVVKVVHKALPRSYDVVFALQVGKKARQPRNLEVPFAIAVCFQEKALYIVVKYERPMF
jgi:hypothetical protein